MNVIDALVVTLGLDAEGFKKGTKEAEQAQESFTKKTQQDSKKREQQSKKASEAETKRAKQFHQEAKKTAEAFRQIKTQALGAAAVFAGGYGLSEFTEHAVNTSANAYEMSRNLNMSARQIAGIEGMVQQFGGSAQEAHGHIQAIQKSIGEFQTVGNLSGALEGYARYGGNQITPISQIKSPLDFYRSAARYAGQNPDHLNKSQMTTVLQQMDISGPMLSAVRGGLASFNKRFHQNEGDSGITEGSAKAMQHFREQWVDLDRELQRVGRHMLQAMRPDIEKLLGAVQEFATWAGGHQKQIQTFFTETGNAIEEFLTKLKSAASWLGIDTGQSSKKNGSGNSSVLHDIWSGVSGAFEYTGKGIGAAAFGLTHPEGAYHLIKSGLQGGGNDSSQSISPDMANALRSFYQRPAINPQQSLGVPNVSDYWRRIHGGTVHNTTNHTQVGDVTVNTQASDAQGTADALHSRLYSMVPLADTGER